MMVTLVADPWAMVGSPVLTHWTSGPPVCRFWSGAFLLPIALTLRMRDATCGALDAKLAGVNPPDAPVGVIANQRSCAIVIIVTNACFATPVSAIRGIAFSRVDDGL